MRQPRSRSSRSLTALEAAKEKLRKGEMPNLPAVIKYRSSSSSSDCILTGGNHGDLALRVPKGVRATFGFKLGAAEYLWL